MRIYLSTYNINMSTFSSEINSVILRNTSNQLILSDPSYGGNYTKITVPVPASRVNTVTIPDVNSDSNIFFSAGSQSISGALNQYSPQFRNVLSERFAIILVAGQRVPDKAAVRVLGEELVKYCT